MSALTLTPRKLNADLEKLVTESCVQLRQFAHDAEYIHQVLYPIFEKNAIHFTIDAETCDLVIPISDVITIHGKILDDSPVYDITVSIKISNNVASKTLGRLSPEAFEHNMPWLKSVITKLMSLSQTYIGMVRNEKAALTINSLVQIELGDDIESVSVVPSTNSNSCFLLTTEILSGVRLLAPFDISNYQEKCAQFKEAVKYLPQCFRETVWQNIGFEYLHPELNINEKGDGGQGIWNDVNPMMCYPTVISGISDDLFDDISPDDSKLFNILRRMGFKFYYDKNQFEITLDDNTKLCRKNRESLFVHNNIKSQTLNLTIQEFTLVLKMIAMASARKGYYLKYLEGLNKMVLNDFVDGLYPFIHEFLPDKSQFGICAQGLKKIMVYFDKTAITIWFKSNRHNAIKEIWNIVKNIRAIEKITLLSESCQAVRVDCCGNFSFNRSYADRWIPIYTSY